MQEPENREHINFSIHNKNTNFYSEKEQTNLTEESYWLLTKGLRVSNVAVEYLYKIIIKKKTNQCTTLTQCCYKHIFQYHKVPPAEKT